MNILFVGSGDITANYLADRLYREGHQISWVTKDEKSFLLNKDFKGKIYREGYQVNTLKSILRLQGIDTVVFAYESYVGDPWEEKTESLIPALQNILKALENHRLKHFVYLSTIELEYRQVLTPKLAELEYGENLCRSFQKRKELPLLILRTGMCYGRYYLDKMGYIGKVILDGMEGKTVICRCARDSYVDPIFGEDAAVAAADLMTLGKCGTYRILSGHPMTMEELHSILSVIIQKEIRVKFLNEEDTLPREAYRESSRKLKEETGWMPFCLLREKELNNVPMEEALKINDYELRRKMVMDTLKEDNTLDYLNVLKEALENEDSETSHYASSIIMLLQEKTQKQILAKEKALEEDPENQELGRELEEELFVLLDSRLLAEENLRRYYLEYDKVSDHLLEEEMPEEKLFRHRISICFQKGDFTAVQEIIRQYENLYPKSEDAVLCRLQFCIYTKDSAGLAAFLGGLGDRPVTLTQKTLEYVRFFRAQGKKGDGAKV